MEDLIAALRRFVGERDWDRFHSPKNLVMALGGEVGELLEPFQWLTEDQSRDLNPEQLAQVDAEVGDVLIYLIMLCDRLGIDPLDAARRKLEVNATKYPADVVRGKALKSTEYSRS